MSLMGLGPVPWLEVSACLALMTVSAAGGSAVEGRDRPAGVDAASPPLAARSLPTEGRTPIYVGGLFPLQNSELFGLVDETVLTACRHINEMDGILDGYELRMRWNWTEGGADKGLRLLYDLVYLEPTILMAWGPMFSSVAVVTNEVAAKYNIIQITLANSPTLLNRTRFPLTVRFGPLENELNPPRLALMREMGWRRAAIVFEDIEYFRSNSENLEQTLVSGGITILTVEAVKDKDQHRAQISNLMQHDARIIFAHFYAGPASKFFCEVYRLGAYGPHIIWILNGWINDGWWRYNSTNNSPCTSAELEQVLRYHVAFQSYYREADVDAINFGGVRPTQEQQSYLQTLVSAELSVRDLLSQSYDGMLLMGMALNASVGELARLHPPRGLQDFHYGDAQMRDVFMRSVKAVEFHGSTSQLSMDENAARTGESLLVVVKQFQGTQEDPMKRVLLLETAGLTRSFMPVENNSFVWHGDSPPVDGKTVREKVVVVSWKLRLGACVIGAVGVAIAVSFVYINMRYRHKRAIKISSPKINNLTAVGALLLYAFVFVNSVDSPEYPDTTITVLCHVSKFLLCVGFSLAFGALFMKTFRIHSIFTKAVTQLKKVELPDRKLVIGACMPVLADVGIMGLELVVDDVRVYSEYGDVEEDTSQPGRDVYVVPVRRACGSEHQLYFLGALYAAKGVLLAFGIFLAWETRLISVAELNDSKYLAISIYIVALTVSITVPVSALMNDDVNFNYVIVSAAVILATTTVLCLVFLPKAILLWKTADNDLSITMMKGAKFSSSTVRSFRNSDTDMHKLRSTLQKKVRQLRVLERELQSLR